MPALCMGAPHPSLRPWQLLSFWPCHYKTLASTKREQARDFKEPHMPWLANTFWQFLLSLVLFCCKHC